MVFSSLVFLFLFLPCTLILYYLVPKNLKNPVLLLASLFFYSWGEPVYLLLMILSILVNYAFGLLIERSKALANPAIKFELALAVLWNIGALFFFKYYALMQDTFRFLPVLNVALPIGISFYTFQALSYVVDVYRGKNAAQKSFISFALYISMFPQLIAGPIVRYSDIESSLSERPATFMNFGLGVDRFIRGLAMKVFLANNFGQLYETLQTMPEKTVLLFWLSAIAYALQIYFDFAGYSEMAIGLGSMFGFRFPKNFDHPYMATSVTDFWRRWHISLGTWFREYVYIPLGGNRVSVFRHILNLLIVWMLTGLWHGASWNFLLWGLYYAILLILEKYVFGRLWAKVPALGRIVTLFLVIIGWVFFSHTNISDAWASISGLFGVGAAGFADSAVWYYVKSYGILMIVGITACTPVISKGYRFLLSKAPVLGAVIKVVLFILCVAALIFESFNPFLYFRF